MANLAVILKAPGKYDKAEKLELYVVETRRKILGRSHSETLYAMKNLAITLEGQGRKNEALELDEFIYACFQAIIECLDEKDPKTKTQRETLKDWCRQNLSVDVFKQHTDT